MALAHPARWCISKTSIVKEPVRSSTSLLPDLARTAGGWPRARPRRSSTPTASAGRRRVVTSREEAVAAAAELGESVALKVVAPSILHKTEVGGLALDVQGSSSVAAAYDRVTSVAPDATGALIQEFVRGGHEVLIGMTEDPSFGPLLAFGLGGIFVELLGDVAFRINPLTDVDAAEMISEVKASKLLDGYRGGDPGDIPAAARRAAAGIGDDRRPARDRRNGSQPRKGAPPDRASGWSTSACGCAQYPRGGCPAAKTFRRRGRPRKSSVFSPQSSVGTLSG